MTAEKIDKVSDLAFIFAVDGVYEGLNLNLYSIFSGMDSFSLRFINMIPRTSKWWLTNEMLCAVW